MESKRQKYFTSLNVPQAKETFRFRIRIRIANFNGNFKEGGLFVQLKEKVKTVIGLYITTQPTDRPQILKRLSKDQ